MNESRHEKCKPPESLDQIKDEIEDQISQSIKHREDSKKEIDQACRTAEEFTKLYYENLDKRRHLIIRMYMDTSVLVWNGTGTTGKDEIGKFLLALPATEHTLWSLDAQRVLDPVANKLAFLIKASGSVKFQTRIPKPFTQTFMITTQDDKWKIVTDCLRFKEPVGG